MMLRLTTTPGLIDRRCNYDLPGDSKRLQRLKKKQNLVFLLVFKTSMQNEPNLRFLPVFKLSSPQLFKALTLFSLTGLLRPVRFNFCPEGLVYTKDLLFV